MKTSLLEPDRGGNGGRHRDGRRRAPRKFPKTTIIEAIQYAHSEIRRIVAAQKELFALLGLKKREFTAPVRDEALYEEVREQDRKGPARGHGHFQVRSSSKAIARLPSSARRWSRAIRRTMRPSASRWRTLWMTVEERLFRDDVLEKRQRPDQRAFDQVRAISSRSRIAAAHARFGAVYAR